MLPVGGVFVQAKHNKLRNCRSVNLQNVQELALQFQDHFGQSKDSLPRGSNATQVSGCLSAHSVIQLNGLPRFLKVSKGLPWNSTNTKCSTKAQNEWNDHSANSKEYVVSKEMKVAKPGRLENNEDGNEINHRSKKFNVEKGSKVTHKRKHTCEGNDAYRQAAKKPCREMTTSSPAQVFHANMLLSLSRCNRENIGESSLCSLKERSASRIDSIGPIYPCGNTLHETPDFILHELKQAKGTGEFTGTELMITLLFAHQLLTQRMNKGLARDSAHKGSIYAKVKARMGHIRSRASIRRKIEKIVCRDTGITGGLLKEGVKVNLVLHSIWSKLAGLLFVSERHGNSYEQEFAKRFRIYANSYADMNKSNFERSGVKVPFLRHASEYSLDGTGSFFKSIVAMEPKFIPSTN